MSEWTPERIAEARAAIDLKYPDGTPRTLSFDWLVEAFKSSLDTIEAQQAELEAYRTHGDDMASAIDEYIADGNISRMIYAQELWDMDREKHDTARAGQGEDSNE